MNRPRATRARWQSNRAFMIGAALAVLLAPAVARAQGGQDSIPSRNYFNTFAAYNNGDFRTAASTFLDEGRGGIRNAQSAWIDSICYYTMTGESYYQLGRLNDALTQYNSALTLYKNYSGWMVRVTFPSNIPQGGAKAFSVVPWGKSGRGTKIGSFPDSFPMGQGQIDNNAVIQKGGVVQQPKIFPIHAGEIVRCTALAMRRRREIMGPACKYDKLTAELVTELSRRPGPPNNWSQAWVDVQLGAALASAGSTTQAISSFERAVIVGGEYDHPLTSTALFELGRLALESGDYKAAAKMFEETTYSAVNFADPALLEEAFRYGQMTHLMSGGKGIYPPLSAAVAWAKTKGLRHLHASLALLAAENLAARDQTPTAATMVAEARTTIGRSDMANSHVGARLNHMTALLAYQTGNVPAGDQALTAALAFQKTGSLWLFHIGLADSLHLNAKNDITDRVAMALYEAVLRDPLPLDWGSSPLECLAVMNTPHLAAYEHWFDVALKSRKEVETALEIGDRMKRHRFFSSLPMGGRLLALRWLLEGPDELLNETATLQRQDLLSRYPKYAELSAKARKLRETLNSGPLVPDDNAERRKQASQLTELAGLGQAQEVILREMAVRREPCELVFPPLRKTKEVQQSLAPGQALLAFVATSTELHGFLFGHERYAPWRVSATVQLQKQLGLMLREMGHFEQNHQVSAADLSKAAWSKSAAKVMDTLFDKSNVDLSDKFEELMIVPDGVLWYLPFEALPVGPKGQTKPLISHVKLRYAPTMGLTVPYARGGRSQQKLGVVVGKLYPHDDAAVAQTAFESLNRSVPRAVALPSTLLVPSSSYRSLLGSLVVLDDVEPGDGAFDWSPAQIDRGKAGSALSAWFPLPWGSPTEVILPGFHTAAENGMKKKNGGGNEVFLSVLGLMSTGARTVLISRWRTGGQASFDLVREFVQELPNTVPDDAWQRAVQLTMAAPLEPENEPRMKKLPADTAAPKGEHPLFWAGYMLIDSGQVPDKAPEAAAKPVLNFKEKGKPPAAAPGAEKAPRPPAAKGKQMEADEEMADEDAADGDQPAKAGKAAGKKAVGKAKATPTPRGAKKKKARAEAN